MEQTWQENTDKIKKIINGIRCYTFRICPYEPDGIERGKNNEFRRNYNLCFDKLCSLLKEITIEDYEHSIQNNDSKIKAKCLHIFHHEYFLFNAFGTEKKILAYIKIGLIDNKYILMVSFHEDETTTSQGR